MCNDVPLTPAASLLKTEWLASKQCVHVFSRLHLASIGYAQTHSRRHGREVGWQEVQGHLADIADDLLDVGRREDVKVLRRQLRGP